MGSLGIMDSLLVEGYSGSASVFKFIPDSPSSVFYYQDSASGITLGHDFVSSSTPSYDPGQIHTDSASGITRSHGFVSSPSPSYNPGQILTANQTSSCSESSELGSGVGDSPEAPDFPDDCIKFLSYILMEEDLDDKLANIQDYVALRATEKSLYDAIGETYLPSSDQFPQYLGPSLENPDYYVNRNGCSHVGNGCSTSESLLSAEIRQDKFDWIWNALSSFPDMGNPECYKSSSRESKAKNHQVLIEAEKKGRKHHQRDDSDDDQDRSNKHLAAYREEEVKMEQFDDILLCRDGKVSFPSVRATNLSSSKEESTKNSKLSEKVKASKSKGLRGKKQSNKEDVVDLNPLLTQCAQAVASFDFRIANDLIKRIRQHSSPYGDSIQRVAHYFANGLEARLAGTASQLYSDFINWQISASLFLKAYRSYVSAIPFKRTSFFLANKTLVKLSAKAAQIHVIDFGIFFGVQWPCFIQSLSQRPDGPPKLRITAVEFPERGYQPAARVEETGKRLAGYCMRFNVPFEYHAIAQRWETLQPEDFGIKGDENEMLVVNCLYRSKALFDETVVEGDSPRDNFLKLIRRLNPALFIHGIVNGTYNAPFFTTRFKELLYHYSTMFDLYEATMPREDDERQLIERELYGRDILNVVACEGAERVDRPETYKQWQTRNQRAGLRQVPLDREIVEKAKAMVKANYHKDFVVNEDNNWLLQGWKGRLLYAVSCWKPA